MDYQYTQMYVRVSPSIYKPVWVYKEPEEIDLSKIIKDQNQIVQEVISNYGRICK